MKNPRLTDPGQPKMVKTSAEAKQVQTQNERRYLEAKQKGKRY